MTENFITPQIITFHPRQIKGRRRNILHSPAMQTTDMIVPLDRAIISGFASAKLQLLNNTRLM